MNEKIIDEIIKSLGSNKIGKNSDFQPRITEERKKQYDKVFGKMYYYPVVLPVSDFYNKKYEFLNPMPSTIPCGEK